MNQDSNLLKFFVDICRGYTISQYNKKVVYLKHFNIEDQCIIDSEYNLNLKKAKDNGLPSKDDVINRLKKQGFWSNEKNDEIEKIRNEIKTLQKIKNRQFLPSKIEELNKKIEDNTAILVEKESDLNSLINYCAEFYAIERSNDCYLNLAIFKDKNLTENFISPHEVEEVSPEELTDIILLYNSEVINYNEENIKKIALSDMCLNYFFLCDDIYSFFGKKTYELSFFQLRLANHAKYFKSVIENNDMSKIPEEIRTDPNKLIDYVNTDKNMEDMIQKTNRESDKESVFSGTSFIGAKKKDIETLQNKSESIGVDIFAKAKEKGGMLDLNDFINMRR